MGLIDLIEKYIKRTSNGRPAKMENAKWHELPEDTWVDQWKYAKGSKFKVFETKNFSWLVFDKDTVLTNSATPMRRIFKW